MEENVFQIIGGVTINVAVSLKNFMFVKKMIFGILLHVDVRMDEKYENIQKLLWMIQQLYVMKL